MNNEKNTIWQSPRNWDGSNSWENEMIDEKDIENFVKLNRWDLAHLAIKQNENELDNLRKEVKSLREQLQLLKEIK